VVIIAYDTRFFYLMQLYLKYGRDISK